MKRNKLQAVTEPHSISLEEALKAIREARKNKKFGNATTVSNILREGNATMGHVGPRVILDENWETILSTQKKIQTNKNHVREYERLTPEKKGKIKADIKQGIPLTEIAKKHKIEEQTAMRVVGSTKK